MCNLPRSVFTVLVFLLGTALASAQVSVLTQHNDNSRTGANLNETILTTSNVSTGTFGKLFSRSVDGQVYAQPLYMPNVAIPGQGTHNVVYVATEHDSVYAFDADDPAQSTPLWQVSMGTPEPAADSDCDNLTPEIGITSTPVIDPASQTLYLVAKTKENGTWLDRIHALDITTGSDKITPAVIQGSVPGTGEGGSTIPFNSLREYNRPGLLLDNGVLAIAFASACDRGPYHGWVFTYDAGNLQQLSVYADSPNGIWDGIWQSGQGLVADANHNIYLTTGNGTFDATASPTDFGEAFLKLSTASGLSVADWFVPYDYANLNAHDLDVSSGGPVGIPGTNLIVGGGKEGKLYLLDTTNMGHYTSGADAVVQEWQAVGSRIYGAPVFWNAASPTLFIWGSQDSMKAYPFSGGTFATTPSAVTSLVTPTGLSSIGALSVSSNGSTPGSGIVWAAVPEGGDPDAGVTTGTLHAYDASNIATELWNSRQNAARDDYGNYSKFCPPTVANGKVYQATFSNQLAVYGLLAPFPPPSITSIVPVSAAACGLPVTLTINGTDFVSGATAAWNGLGLATSFVSATQLTAVFPAADTAAAGVFPIYVVNPPAAGSEDSSTKTFTVTVNPVPNLTYVSPASVTADTAAFTLTAGGSSFTQCSTVLWNGSALVTTFVSTAKLTAAVPASLITTVDTPSITVVSPRAGGGTSAAKTLPVDAPALTSLSLAPNSLTGGAALTGKVTLNAPALAGGQTVSLTTTNSTAAPLPSPPSVTVPGGAATAAFTITTTPVAADTPTTITAALGAVSKPATLTVKAPVLMSLAVSPNSVFGGFGSTGTVTLSGKAPAGGVTINLGSSNPGAAGVDSSVTVAPGAAAATFPITTTVVTAQAVVTITASLGATSKTAPLTVKAIAPSALALSPGNVFGGFGATGTVTLNSPAPSGGITVTLGSSIPGTASADPSVMVLAGASKATFPITTALVPAAANVTITATFGAAAKTAILMVKAITPTMVTLSPTSVYGGAGSTGTVTINSPAPAGGVTVTLSSSNAGVASVNATVPVAPGATSATFPVTTFPVAASTNVTLSAACGGITKSATLTVKQPVLATALLASASVKGGTQTTLTVTLSSPAPAAGTTVSFTSSKPTAAAVQANAVIPSGATTATVNVTTAAVTTSTAVTLTASGGGVMKTQTLTVTP